MPGLAASNAAEILIIDIPVFDHDRVLLRIHRAQRDHADQEQNDQKLLHNLAPLHPVKPGW
jgi:hypothetical protein